MIVPYNFAPHIVQLYGKSRINPSSLQIITKSVAIVTVWINPSTVFCKFPSESEIFTCLGFLPGSLINTLIFFHFLLSFAYFLNDRVIIESYRAKITFKHPRVVALVSVAPVE